MAVVPKTDKQTFPAFSGDDKLGLYCSPCRAGHGFRSQDRVLRLGRVASRRFPPLNPICLCKDPVARRIA